MEDAKKKSVAALIVAKMKPKEEAPEGEDINGRVEAVKEMMSALKDDDAEAFSDALESFVEMCRSEE